MQFVIWVTRLKIYSDDNARLIEDWRTQPDSVVDILTVTVVMHRHSGPVRSALGKLVHLTPNEVGTLMIHICQVTQEISRVNWQYDDIQQLFCFAVVCYRPISTPHPSPHTLPPQPPRTPTRSPTQPTPTPDFTHIIQDYFTDTGAIPTHDHSKLKVHWINGDGPHFYFIIDKLHRLYRIAAYIALVLKSLSSECHRVSLMRIQHWFK